MSARTSATDRSVAPPIPSTGRPPTAAAPTAGSPPEIAPPLGERASTGAPRRDAPADVGRRPGRARRVVQRWSRPIHVYTSMIALVVVLFFAVTGLTLNHPSWTFGSDVSTSTESGTFPFPTELGDGAVDYLSIAEYVRDEHGVVGEVADFGETSGEGSIAFANPGYRADLSFDVDAGSYDLVIDDLHKGRDAGSSWSWVIDASAAFLIVVSLSGLAMQVVMRKRRRTALALAAVGALATAAAAMVALS